MATIIEKRIETLTEDERDQITKLIQRYFPYLNEEYSKSWTVEGPDFDVILLKKQKEVLGVCYFKTFHLLTPFYPKEIPVIHFGLALKKPGFKGNIIGRIGRWYAVKKIGLFFPFKRIAGISAITAPRALENFVRRFPLNSTNFPSHSSNTIFRFVQNFFSEHRRMFIELDFNSCFEYHTELMENVTDDWHKYFKANNKKLNELFLSNSIYIKQEDQVFKTSKAFVVCGYRAGFSKI